MTPLTVPRPPAQAPLSIGFFQARILGWVAISFSRGSSWSRDGTWISCTEKADSLLTELPRKPIIPLESRVIVHCMSHMPHFIYSLISRWAFGFFPPFGYCESCSVNTAIQYLFKTLLAFKCKPRRGVAGSQGKSILYGGTTYSFRLWLHHFAFLPAVYKVSSFSTSLPRFIFSFGFLCF